MCGFTAKSVELLGNLYKLFSFAEEIFGVKPGKRDPNSMTYGRNLTLNFSAFFIILRKNSNVRRNINSAEIFIFLIIKAYALILIE
jgi:hypothetical protein